jgi:hypothetical protein
MRVGLECEELVCVGMPGLDAQDERNGPRAYNPDDVVRVPHRTIEVHH